MVEGTSLQSRYRLDRRVAVGGMGAVFEAFDERLNRTVAVKILKEELAGDPRFVERFRREARAVASLSHPSIANVYDYGEDENHHFIVMEYARGEDLARILRSVAPLSTDRANHIATQMCAALGHAHSAGIIHRDIKPANVIVAPGDRVKVTDFGIARAAGDSTLTATGSVLGTAQYLSPEQASGGSIGPQSDVYATGIVVYEMLTGTVPYTGDSAVAIAMRHVSEEVPPPSKLNPDVSGELDAIVARATAKAPEDRFRDGREMAGALEGAARPTAEGRTVVLGPLAPTVASRAPGGTKEIEGAGVVWPVPGNRWDPRKIGRVVLITFGVLLVLAAAALGWRLLSADDEPAAAGGRDRRQEQQAPQETTSPEPAEPESFTIEEGIIGSNFKDAEKALKDSGFSVERVDVSSDAAKDTVVGVDPDVGTTVTPGEDTITLFVSTGEEEDDDEDEPGPPDVPPGQEKREDEEDDD